MNYVESASSGAIVLIGVPRSDYMLAESVLHARLRGRNIVLVDTDTALSRISGRLSVETRPVSEMGDPDRISNLLDGLKIDYVLSFSELHLGVASQVRRLLGIPGVPSEVEAAVRNKGLTRDRLSSSGLTRVHHAVCGVDDLESTAAEFRFPYVVKPVDLTGSIGVRAVRSPSELNEVSHLFADLSAERGRERRMLIEEFIEGVEFSVEGICLDGKFYMYAITEKANSGYPFFYETGHMVPASEDIGWRRVASYVQSVVSVLSVNTAPIHAEVMISGHEIELVEIHTRFGGDMIPLLVERSYGASMVGDYYDALIYGKEPRVPDRDLFAGVYFIPRGRVSSLVPILPDHRGCKFTLSVDERVENGDPSVLDNLTIPNPRSGYVIFESRDRESAERFFKAAQESIFG